MSNKEYVERGAKLLDEKHPGWAAKIDTSILNIRFSDRCILGQLYGWFYQALDSFGILFEDCYLYGFSENYALHPDENWEYLDDLWRQEINDRLSDKS